MRLGPWGGARLVFQHQGSVRSSSLPVRIRVMQLRNLELEKAESHPARRADLGPVPPTWLRDLGIKFGMPDLATPGDDRIGKILPDDGQKLAGGSVPPSCERRQPTDPDHRVATPPEPIDIRHIMKFDPHHRV